MRKIILVLVFLLGHQVMANNSLQNENQPDSVDSNAYVTNTFSENWFVQIGMVNVHFSARSPEN